MKHTPLKRKKRLAVQSTLTRRPMQRKSKPSRRNKKVTTYTQTLREDVFARDGGLCQLCGGCGEQIHHIIGRGRFDSRWYTFSDVHDQVNLMLICNRCHMKIHNDNSLMVRVIELQEKRFGPLRKIFEDGADSIAEQIRSAR